MTRLLRWLAGWSLLLLLGGCLGNGGGGDNDSVFDAGDSDSRVASVKLLANNNNQAATGEAAIVLTVLVRNAQEQPVAGAEARLSADSDTALFEAITGETDNQGRFITRVVNTRAESFTVTATVGGVESEPVELTFVAPVSGIELNAEQTLLKVQDSTRIQLTLRQSGSNIVGYAGDRLPDTPFSATVSGPGQLEGVPATTDGNGEAVFTLTATGPGAISLIVASGVERKTLSLHAGAKLSLLPENTNAIGEISLRALLQDSEGAPLVGESILFNLLENTNETLEPAQAITTGDGTAEVNIKDLGADGGEIVAQAVAGQLTAQARVSFLADLGQDRNLGVEASARALPPGASATLTARILDGVEVPISGQKITFSVDSPHARLSTTEGLTDANGEVRVTVDSSQGENVTVTIRAGTARQTVLLYFGASLRLTTTQTQAVADGETAYPITASVLDASGGGISGIPVEFRASGSALLEHFRVLTDDNGRALNNLTNYQAETVTISANTQALSAESVSLVFGVRVGGLELSVGESLLTSRGSTSVTVILRETVSNAVDSANTRLPNMPFNATVSGPARLENVPPTTDLNGEASFTLTATGPGRIDLVVSSGAVSRSARLYAGGSLQILPGLSNAMGEAQLKVLLLDGNNAPLVDQDVLLNLQVSQARGNETLDPGKVVTGDDGTAEFTVKDLSQDGGRAVVEATADQLSASPATVNFLTDLGQGRSLEVEVPSRVLAGDETATITARILDEVGVPVPNQLIGFEVDGQAELSADQGVTDPSGEVSITVGDRQNENVTVIVRAGTQVREVPLYFGARLELVALQSQGLADGNTPLEVVATVLDASGAGIPGIPVDFRATGAALLESFQQPTNNVGRAPNSLTNTRVEDVTLTAAAGMGREGSSLNKSLSLNFALESRNLPANISLDTVPPGQTELPLNTLTQIVATVTDIDRMPIKDGIVVNFTTNLGTVTETTHTRGGQAVAWFNPGTRAGMAAITATIERGLRETLIGGQIGDSVGPISVGLSIQIRPSTTGIIEVESIIPPVIGIKGSGIGQTSTIRFLVKDNLGNPVEDGTEVRFSLDTTGLNGGETISTGNAEGREASTFTSNGLASVTLKSGFVAGNADILAEVSSTDANGNPVTISALARVTLVGGLPDARHFGLGVEYRNIAGGVTLGLKNNITAYLGDRFGNVVPDGTAVSFVSEGGTIGTSPQSGAFEVTTEDGVASATLRSAYPNTPELGGVAPAGNVGLSTIMAYTTGSESFEDANGNGVYDAGETFEDLSEPYLDGNDNGRFESGELYVDVNNNGMFDNGNGVHDSNTLIWTSGRVMFSGPIDLAAPYVTKAGGGVISDYNNAFAIPKGGQATFYLRGLQDVYGNPLTSRTSLEIDSSGGVLGGTVEIEEFSDTLLPFDPVVFTLASDPPRFEGDPPVEVYPGLKAASITIKVNSPAAEGEGDSPGGNGGGYQIVLSGTINN